MKCPNCGEEMSKGKFKCMRCGYVVKDLSVNVNGDDKDNKDDEPETVDIDPSRVYVSGGGGTGGGGVFEDVFGGGLFGGLFGGILDDIFGFGGFDDARVSYDIFGNPVYDEEDDETEAEEVVEIRHVEYLDENGNPIDKKGKKNESRSENKKKKNSDKSKRQNHKRK